MGGLRQVGILMAFMAAVSTPTLLFAGLPPEVESLCREGMACLRAREPQILQLGLDTSAIVDHHLKEVRELDHSLARDSLLLNRAILKLKKLKKYCQSGEFRKLGEQPFRPGFFDEQDRILGSQSQELELLKNHGNPQVSEFIQALYERGAVCPFELSPEERSRPSHFYMITAADSGRVEAAAAHELRDLLLEMNGGRGVQEAVRDSTLRAGVTWVLDVENEWNDWKVEVDVDLRGVSLANGAYYLPPSVVAIHELGHVARIAPGQKEDDPDSQAAQSGAPLEELGPVLDQIILQDQLVKSVNGEPLSSKRTYPCHPPVKSGKETLDLGELANVFRELEHQYGSAEAAVLSPEGRAFIGRFF